MERTSMTVKEQTKDRLDNYRHPDHESWSETLEGMMAMLPTIEEIQEGCVNCGKERPDSPTEDLGGVIRWFYSSEQDLYGANFFCSTECAQEMADQIDAYIPEEPDLVIVGGADEIRTEFTDATFYMEGTTTQVGLDIPGAFSGTSSLGHEYDYVGEPVYVKNEDQWVHTGVIEEIFHEEAHTTLDLGYDMATTHLNHPDEETREDYKEQHAEWADIDCHECGTSLSVCVPVLPDKCPECGEEITSEHVE